jgi:hypothetical protein
LRDLQIDELTTGSHGSYTIYTEVPSRLLFLISHPVPLICKNLIVLLRFSIYTRYVSNSVVFRFKKKGYIFFEWEEYFSSILFVKLVMFR